MTVYFAPPGEPLDGDNWQELGLVTSDGVQFEHDRLGEFRGQTINLGPFLDEGEVSIEITPELNRIHALPTGESFSFDLKPSREFTKAFFGFDIYALADTVAEWLNRPATSHIPKIYRLEIVRAVNRLVESEAYIQDRMTEYLKALKGN